MVGFILVIVYLNVCIALLGLTTYYVSPGDKIVVDTGDIFGHDTVGITIAGDESIEIEAFSGNYFYLQKDYDFLSSTPIKPPLD